MCSAWPQKPSNPHLKSRWEQAHFTKSNHLDCLPLQGILACFSLSSFTPVITNEEESKEQSRDEPGEQLTAFSPSAVHSHGRTQVPTRVGLEQLDANSSLKLLVSKCPRQCNGFEESSSNVSRAPATFLIKPRTKLQGVLVHSG